MGKKKAPRRKARLEMGTDGEIRDISNKPIKLQCIDLSVEAERSLNQLLADYGPCSVIKGVVKLGREDFECARTGGGWLHDPEWAEKMTLVEEFLDALDALVVSNET